MLARLWPRHLRAWGPAHSPLGTRPLEASWRNLGPAPSVAPTAAAQDWEAQARGYPAVNQARGELGAAGAAVAAVAMGPQREICG